MKVVKERGYIMAENMNSLPNTLGRLIVILTHARGLFPVEAAVVQVYSTDGTELVSTVTDMSGRTEVIELPAPSKTLSSVPGGADPTAFYDIFVEAEGFVPTRVKNVKVYEGVTSLQKLDLPYKTASNDAEWVIDLSRASDL